jgi:predicted nucleic acid-binding protein
LTRAFFYDTWAFAALANRSDPAHAIAVELDEALERQGFAGVTTDYVLDEVVTLLHAAAGARASLPFLDLMNDRSLGSDLMIVSIGEVRRARASALFRKLSEERRLSFTDATSFTVMEELGIKLAFTADQHFHRAGAGIRPLVMRRKGRFVTTPL